MPMSAMSKNKRKTNWVHYPRSLSPPQFMLDVVDAFIANEAELLAKTDTLKSNGVLAIIRPNLVRQGFEVESGKKAEQKIRVPVLFGRNGAVEKSFEADAWHRDHRVVLEVEAGRGYLNNQFLKDLFQACMMNEVDYCAIAVKNMYQKSRDFESIVAFFETLYTSGRLALPLKGVLLIGYG